MNSDKDSLQAERVSPFGNPRIKAYLPAPRGLSQTNTSFIACCRLGIHHVRLFAWPYNPKPSLDLFCDHVVAAPRSNPHVLVLYTPVFTRRASCAHKKSLRESTTFLIRFLWLKNRGHMFAGWKCNIPDYIFNKYNQWDKSERDLSRAFTTSKLLKNNLETWD